MKKFIVYLLVIVMAVSLGFAVFYLVKDDEVIYIGQDPNSIDLKQVGNYTVMRYPSYFIDENGSDLDIDIHIL